MTIPTFPVRPLNGGDLVKAGPRIGSWDSPKFTGDENGERKDWVATGDVLAWLRETFTQSVVAGENAVSEFNVERAA